MGYKYRISCVDYIIMGIIYRSMDIGERTFGLDGHNRLPIQTRLTRLADGFSESTPIASVLSVIQSVSRAGQPSCLACSSSCLWMKSLRMASPFSVAMPRKWVKRMAR